MLAAEVQVQIYHRNTFVLRKLKPQIVPYRSAKIILILWYGIFMKDLSCLWTLGNLLCKHIFESNWSGHRPKTTVQLPTCHRLRRFPPRLRVREDVGVHWVEGLGPLRFKYVRELGPCQSQATTFVHLKSNKYWSKFTSIVFFYIMCLQISTIG